MNRYTAIRPSMILAAVAKPLVIMAIYLLLASKVDSGYLLLLIALLVFVIILPALCVDPVVEDEETRRRPDHGGLIRAVCAILLTRWILDQPEVETFLSALKSRLWDWRPMTVVAIFCLMRCRSDLRAALHFKATDLYPHLKRDPQPEVS